MRFLERIIVVFFLVLSLFGCQKSGVEKNKIVVGGKNFTEQAILATLSKILLEKAGFEVELKTGVGSNLARKSLENKQFDLYYEYTGTAYTVYYNQDDMSIMNNAVSVYKWVKEKDLKKGLIWLEPLPFNNTYTLLMKKDKAQNLKIKSISDLSEYVKQHPNKLILGIGPEFWQRPDGFQALMKVYGLAFPTSQIKKMTIGLTYKALKDSQIDVAMGFATDGRIDAFGFSVLTDNKHFFPVYHPAPVVRQEILNTYPRIQEVLKPLTQALTTQEMQKLNAAVDIQHESEWNAAQKWLKEKKLL